MAQAFALTAAQIRASTLAPVTLVAAPGGNQVLVPALVVYGYTFVSIAYSSGIFRVTAAGLTFDGIAGGSSVVGAFSFGSQPAQARASVVNKPIALILTGTGPISTTSVSDGGHDYAPNDTGNAAGGTGSGATYRVLTVGAGGAVLTYTITNPGLGYQAEDTVTLVGAGVQPGIGAEADLTVDTVDTTGETGNGLIAGTVYYVVSAV